MSTPFRTCPLCGCNLDPGEMCDCAAPAADRAAAETARLTPPERAYHGPDRSTDDHAAGRGSTTYRGQ